MLKKLAHKLFFFFLEYFIDIDYWAPGEQCVGT